MNLEKWLASKQRQQEVEARARVKAAEPAKPAKKPGLFARLLERAHRPLWHRRTSPRPQRDNRCACGLERRSAQTLGRHGTPGCRRVAAGRAATGGRRRDIPHPDAGGRQGWRGGARRGFADGLPRAYAAALPERDFLHFLAATAMRPEFFQVCATLAEVRPDRPFYPARGMLGMTRAAHASALGLADAAGVVARLRPGHGGATGGRAAVLDARGEQVGKAAIAAWQAMLLPALAGGEDIRVSAVRRRLSRTVGARRGGDGRNVSRRGAAPSRDAAYRQQAATGGPGGGRRPACRGDGRAGGVARS